MPVPVKQKLRVKRSIDADATAYIAQIRQSTSASDEQEKAISDWIVAGKSSGWWDLIKYLLITTWGDNTANVVNAISPSTSATVNGTVTPNAGYIQGGGATTDYIDFGVTPSAQGLGLDDASMFIDISGNAGAADMAAMGCRNTNAQAMDFYPRAAALEAVSYFHNTTNSEGRVGYSHAIGEATWITNRSGTAHDFTYTTDGVTSTTDNNTHSDFGTVPTVNLYALAANDNNGTPIFPSDKHVRMLGFGLGLTDAQADDFVLKTHRMLNLID